MTFASQDRSDPHLGRFHRLDSLVERDLGPGVGFTCRVRPETELITYIEQGSLTLGARRLRAGEFCRTFQAAGDRAVNPSLTERAHVFQFGLVAESDSPRPGEEQRRFSLAERRGLLRVIGSPDGRDGALRIHDGARMYSALPDRGTHLIHELCAGRLGWLHVVAGSIQLGEHGLGPGDGAGIADQAAVSFTAREFSEILLLDLRSI